MTSIEDQNKIRDYLSTIFEEKKKNRPSYSLRNFASKIQVSPGNLSQFFNKKKVFNKKTLEKILTILEPNPEVRKEFLHAYNDHLISKIQLKNQITNYPSQKICPVSFDKIKEPIYFNFLNLIETEFYQECEEADVHKNLNITSIEYENLVHTLVTEDLIQMDPSGKYSRKALHLKTDDDISSQAIRYHHKKVIEKSVNALDEVPVELRDITTMTLPTNLEQLPKAKELIRKFQDEMLHLLNQSPRSEVYHMTIALFPANKKQ